MPRRALAALLPVLLLAGCASTTTTTLRDVAPQASASASTAPATSAEPASPADASCRDGKGDGDGFDIRRVELTRLGDSVRVTATVMKVPDFDAQETAAVIMSAFDATGNHGAIFTTKWIGSEIASSVFDVDDSTNSAVVDAAPLVSGKTITLVYPAALLDRAGDGYVWNAVTTLDGADVDECGNAAWKAVSSS